MRIEYHRTLIADLVRNAAFHAALKAAIVPGVTTVADIGAGTGLLGLMAARLGAKDVFLYETAEVAGVAAQILHRNRARNCHVFPCHSTEMDDPPRVDVVVSETLGNYALEENILETAKDAVARHLKPGGALIPRQVIQRVCPVVTSRIQEEFCAWDRVGLDLGLDMDLSPAKAMSMNNIYVRSFQPVDFLDQMMAAKAWDTIDLLRDHRATRKAELKWAIGDHQTIHGFAIWWDVELATGITLSTAPDAPRTHWEQLYLPLLHPFTCRATETLALSIRSKSSSEAGTHLAWTASRMDARGKSLERQSLDLDKGFLP
ncbi:MAG: ribonucleotide-diphosphate reductase subunit beta [Hyphomicrobium sp.]|nr:MAG: ribonucleotide-diphosphate reductase subunit beta [Hyphomicrobium sp.]